MKISDFLSDLTSKAHSYFSTWSCTNQSKHCGVHRALACLAWQLADRQKLSVGQLRPAELGHLIIRNSTYCYLLPPQVCRAISLPLPKLTQRCSK